MRALKLEFKHWVNKPNGVKSSKMTLLTMPSQNSTIRATGSTCGGQTAGQGDETQVEEAGRQAA